MLRRPGPALTVFGGLALFYLLFPSLVVVPMSFGSSEFFNFPPQDLSLRWYRRFFEDPQWVATALRSLRVALAVTAVSLVLGTTVAFALARGRLPAHGVLATLVIAPLIIPNVIIAAGLYVLYVRLRLVNTEIGLVIGHTVLAIPVVTLAVTAAMRAAQRDLERAAQSLGAGSFQTFVRVTLPLVRPGLATGAVLAFITSFDEFIIAVFVAGTTSPTLPLKMFEGTTEEVTPVLLVVATFLVVVSAVGMLIVALLRRRLSQAVPGAMS